MKDDGAGTVLAIAILTIIAGLTLGILNVSQRVVEQVRLNALAENASIAAADALRGLVAGIPCEVAKSMAPVSSCVIEGNDVLIELERHGLRARSRAGEPG
jgi:secretion/DNA translocation related TadE-like protein